MSTHDSPPSATAKVRSPLFISLVVALLRAGILIPSAFAWPGAVRVLYPESFLVPNSPGVLMIVILVVTFVVCYGILYLRNRSLAAAGR